MSGVTAEAKARVDALLFEPLAGLSRKRGVSAEAHDKSMDRLRADLAYMSDDNLRGMVDLIARHAVKGVWPEEGLIRSWAQTLQLPPPRESHYARSLIRSELGARALREGWAVELFQVAKRHGPPPPGQYAIGKLREEAENNAHKVRVIEENRAAGRATEGEIEWLARRSAELAEINEIRAEKESGAGNDSDRTDSGCGEAA